MSSSKGESLEDKLLKFKNKVGEDETELMEEDLKKLFLLRRLSRKDRSVEVGDVNEVLGEHFRTEWDRYHEEVLEYEEPETKSELRKYIRKKTFFFGWEDYDSYKRLKSKVDSVVEETMYLAFEIIPKTSPTWSKED